jgi:hypothetical protein
MVMARLTILVVAAAALLGGCVSVQQIPLTATGGTALKDREIALGVREKPDFAAMRSSTMALGAVAGGLIGGAIMISAGNRLVAENQIEDPALSIQRAVSANLEQAYQARATARSAKLTDDDVAQAARQNAGADLIVDVRTINWSFAYFPTAWTRYRVIYSARLRLIDVKRSQVIAEGLCSRVPDERPDAPTYEQLVADKAALLKRELNLAAEHCVRTFSTETLAIARPAATIASINSQATVPAEPKAALVPGTPGVQPEPSKVAAPAADVTARLAAFSGTWDGHWQGNRRHTLVVEKIDGRTADLVYSRGPGGNRARSSEPSSDRAVGAFAEDESLRVTLKNGENVVYRMSEDRRSLNGEWVHDKRRLEGVFLRREVP